MNCYCMHASEDHDLIALDAVIEFAVVFAADDNVVVLVDNNSHFDYVDHPNASKK